MPHIEFRALQEVLLDSTSFFFVCEIVMVQVLLHQVRCFMLKSEGKKMDRIPKIYFAASIRGGRERVEVYAQICELLAKYGTVLTEHVADVTLTSSGEQKTERDIFVRDKRWILEADFVVAEVTNPSLGVGWEIAYAESIGKKVFCLYSSGAEKSLSAMISGNPWPIICRYETLQEVESFLSEQFFLFRKGK